MLSVIIIPVSSLFCIYLREEQILIISGGLIVHNLRDFSAFAEETAGPHYKEFDRAVLEAAAEPDVSGLLLTLS